ncbi:MAG: MFS transporter [Pseudomonadota bacterium]
MAERRFLVLVVALTCTLNAVARGFTDSFGLFLLPVETELGVTRSTMTGVYSVFMLTLGLAGPVAGHVFDRLGSRRAYLLGLLSLALGFQLAAGAESVVRYYLGAGVLTGIGVAAAGMVPATALLSRWFEGRLGTVLGFAYASMGVGVLVMMPVTQLLLDAFGWRETYALFAKVLLVVALGVVVLPMTRLDRGSLRKRNPAGVGGKVWTLPLALRTGAFWGLFAVYFFTGYAAYSILPQAPAYLIEQGFDALLVASLIGLIGILSVVGMASIGTLADRFGRRFMVTISYLCSLSGITAILAVAIWPSFVLVYGFILFFGVAQGARGPIITVMTARLFEGGGVGSIYGAITMGLGFGAAVGSLLSGVMHDLTGHYFWSFGLAWLASFLGLLQFYVVPALADRKPA